MLYQEASEQMGAMTGRLPVVCGMVSLEELLTSMRWMELTQSRQAEAAAAIIHLRAAITEWTT